MGKKKALRLTLKFHEKDIKWREANFRVSSCLRTLLTLVGREVRSSVHVPDEGHFPESVALNRRGEVLRRLQLIRLAQRQREVVVLYHNRFLLQNSYLRFSVSGLKEEESNRKCSPTFIQMLVNSATPRHNQQTQPDLSAFDDTIQMRQLPSRGEGSLKPNKIFLRKLTALASPGSLMTQNSQDVVLLIQVMIWAQSVLFCMTGNNHSVPKTGEVLSTDDNANAKSSAA